MDARAGDAPPQHRAAVLGKPVAHSLSPLLHRAAYAHLGLDWTYEAIECDERELGVLLVTHADWSGFSCTMPLKRAAVEIAAEAGPRVVAVGAANTLLPGPQGWVAENTDVDGVLGALREHGVTIAPSSVTILGAGGTAQGAVAAVAELGGRTCAVLVRDPARTEQLRRTAAVLGVELAVGTLDPADPALGADLVISTLPARAADQLAHHAWRAGQTVLDVVYHPWPTRLAAAASEGGSTVVGGAVMLLHQAVAQVELMTGRPGPLEAMRAALHADVPECGV